MDRQKRINLLAASQPLVSLLVITVAAVLLGMAVAPRTESARLWIAPFEEYTNAERAEFKSQALIWAAAGVVVITSLLVALAVSVLTILRTMSGRALRSLLIAAPAAFGVIVIVVDRLYASDISAPLGALAEQGFIAWPIEWFTAVANGVTAWSIASLFAAATAIVIAASDDADQVGSLSGRLRLLLTLGAVATVAGVVEINALHSLPAAAARGPASWQADRASLEAAAGGQLEASLRTGLPADSPGAELVDGWLEQELKTEDEDARKAIIPDIMRAMRSDPDLRRQVIQNWLRKADIEARKTARAAQENIASHVASFWGLVFTAALGLLYVPPATFLVTRLSDDKDRAEAAKSLAVGVSASPAKPWDDVVKPFARLLAALAPLLVGVLAELLQTSEKVINSS